MSYSPEVVALATRLASQAGHDPHATVVRGAIAVGAGPEGHFHFIEMERIVPLWTLYAGTAHVVLTEAARLAVEKAEA